MFVTTPSVKRLSTRAPRVTNRRAQLVLAGLLVLASGALTIPASAATTSWHGALDKSKGTTLSFSYSGASITKFLVPSVACLSDTGMQYELLYVPTIRVAGGAFSTTFHPLKSNAKVVVKVKGVIAGGRASGTVTGSGTCDTSIQSFHANVGAFKPVTSPSPAKGSCTMAGCLASDGMFIRVIAVDRTIKSVPQQQGTATIPADPVFQNGGVGVTVIMTDRSFAGPAVVAPAVDFQLRTGAGVLVQGGGPNGTVDSGNGSTYPCSYPPFPGNDSGGTTLTKGASFGPRSVCFAVPTAGGRLHLKLYYARGQGPVDAVIPLG